MVAAAEVGDQNDHQGQDQGIGQVGEEAVDRAGLDESLGPVGDEDRAAGREEVNEDLQEDEKPTPTSFHPRTSMRCRRSQVRPTSTLPFRAIPAMIRP